jgi:hypothetical protein
MKLGTSIASLVLLGTACSVVPDSTDLKGERAQVSVQAVKGTARDVGSGVDGPTVPMSLDVLPHGPEIELPGTPCGPSRCEGGQFCCNESCGLCAPRGGICLQRQCGPATSVLTGCSDDSQCRAISSYCDGCQCLPAGMLDPEPSCHATMVACILDPCHHQHPACVNGACAIVDD